VFNGLEALHLMAHLSQNDLKVFALGQNA